MVILIPLLQIHKTYLQCAQHFDTMYFYDFSMYRYLYLYMVVYYIIITLSYVSLCFNLSYLISLALFSLDFISKNLCELKKFYMNSKNSTLAQKILRELKNILHSVKNISTFEVKSTSNDYHSTGTIWVEYKHTEKDEPLSQQIY